MTKDSTPLSNSEIRDRITKSFMTPWFNQTFKSGSSNNEPTVTTITVKDEQVEAIMQLIEQVCNESRIDELKQLWNYTQSDIVPEGAKPNDMSDRLHERIKELKLKLTKESES